MDATIMSVRDSSNGVDLAASVMLSRLVWLFKPDLAVARKAKSIVAELGERAKVVPDRVKQHGNAVYQATKTIINRGWWAPRMRSLLDEPTGNKSSWITRRHSFRRVAMFSYSPVGNCFCPTTAKDNIVGYPWWDSKRIRQAGRLQLNQAQSKYYTFVKRASSILGSRSIETGSVGTLGTGLFSTTPHTEFSSEWLAKYPDVDILSSSLPIPHAALSDVTTADYAGFRFFSEVGPIVVNVAGITPAVCWDMPGGVLAADPWVFNGEEL